MRVYCLMFIIFLDIDGVVFEGYDSIHDLPDYEVFLKHYLQEQSVYSAYVYEGVLNSYADFKAQTHFFNKDALSNLAKLIGKIKQQGFEVGIVLSSVWREFFDTETIKKLFCLLDFSKYIIDKIYDKAQFNTPEGYESEFERGELIELWLQQHPEVSRFIILDDIDFGFRELFPGNFVHCKNLFAENELEYSLALIPRQEPVSRTFKNHLTPKVVKTFDDNQDCNQCIPEVSMRVLNETRLGFLRSKLRDDDDSPFNSSDKYNFILMSSLKSHPCPNKFIFFSKKHQAMKYITKFYSQTISVLRV